MDESLQRTLAVTLTAVAAVVAAVAMFTAWWTVSFEGNNASGSESAKPFDDGGDGDNGLIDPGEAVLAGVLVLFGILGLAGAAVLMILYHIEAFRPSVLFTPWVAVGAAILLLLAAILALATWPDDNTEFWDSASGGGGGFSFTATTAAGLGWYLALTAAVLGLVGGVLWLMSLVKKAAEPEPPSAA